MKPMQVFAIFILIIHSVTIRGQIGWEWAFAEQSTLESQGEDVCVDKDGNIYLTGYFGGEMKFGEQELTAVNTHDFFVAKLDEHAQLQWIQQGGGTGYNHGNDVVTDSSGNVYITGSIEDKAKAFLNKYGSDGSLQWSQNISAGYHWENKGSLLTTDGKDIFVGSNDGLKKYDAAGTLKHDEGIPLTALSNVENGLLVAATAYQIVVFDTSLSVIYQHTFPSSIERINSITLFQSDIYFTGRYNGSMTIGDVTLDGYQNIFVARMDFTGNIDWINEAGGDSYDTGHSLLVTTGGRMFVAGTFRNSATFDDITIGRPGLFEEIFVAEYDTADGKLADLIHAGGDGDFDVAYGMAATPGNELLVTGSLRDYMGVNFGDIMVNSPSGNIDFFLASVGQAELKAGLNGMVKKSGVPTMSRIKLYRTDQDSVMEMVADKYTDGEGAFSFDIYHSGAYLIKACYNTSDHISTYYEDAFLWNKGSLLQVESDTVIDALDIDLIGLPQLSGSNSISGRITDDEDQAKRFVDIILASEDETPVAYSRSDTTGTYEFTGVPEGSYKILVDTAGLPMYSWYSIEVTNLKTTLKTYTDYDYLFRDGMIYTREASSTLFPSMDPDQVRLYPVPANNQLNVDFKGNTKPWHNIEILDINGRSVLRQEVTGNSELNLTSLPGGIYLLRLTAPDHTILTRKFLKLK